MGSPFTWIGVSGVNGRVAHGKDIGPYIAIEEKSIEREPPVLWGRCVFVPAPFSPVVERVNGSLVLIKVVL